MHPQVRRNSLLSVNIIEKEGSYFDMCDISSSVRFKWSTLQTWWLKLAKHCLCPDSISCLRPTHFPFISREISQSAFQWSLVSAWPFLTSWRSFCREGRKKQNVRCVRYNIDGEARAILVAIRDIPKGERLYYDYNAYQTEYPTQHFVWTPRCRVSLFLTSHSDPCRILRLGK